MLTYIFSGARIRFRVFVSLKSHVIINYYQSCNAKIKPNSCMWHLYCLWVCLCVGAYFFYFSFDGICAQFNRKGRTVFIGFFRVRIIQHKIEDGEKTLVKQTEFIFIAWNLNVHKSLELYLNLWTVFVAHRCVTVIWSCILLIYYKYTDKYPPYNQEFEICMLLEAKTLSELVASAIYVLLSWDKTSQYHIIILYIHTYM